MTSIRRVSVTSVLAAGLIALASQATAATNANPFVGTWVLNLAKSSFTPGPGPKAETIKVEVLADGTMKSTVDEVTANGTVLHGGTAYSLDGKDHPVTPAPAPGAPGYDALSFTQTGSNTVDIALKRDGKVIGRRTIVISTDGNTETETQEGLGSDGKPMKDVWVFDRQAAM